MARTPSSDDDIFALRLDRSARTSGRCWTALYGPAPRLPRLPRCAAEGHAKGMEGPRADLKRLDLKRDLEPGLVPTARHGGLCLLHRPLCGTLPRFWKAGLSAGPGRHLRPFHALSETRTGDSDGGYSVLDYRAINPA